jgi:NitT/TauT family transport system substrate-binding protein
MRSPTDTIGRRPGPVTFTGPGARCPFGDHPRLGFQQSVRPVPTAIVRAGEVAVRRDARAAARRGAGTARADHSADRATSQSITHAGGPDMCQTLRGRSTVTRRSFLATSTLAAAGALAPWGAAPGRASTVDKLTFGTNWKAQAEHGGYYQAVATGIYRKYNLDVTIRMGGPQINHPQLLASGTIDFNMGSNSFSALNYVKNNIPMVAVGAIFQKDPQVLIAHAGQGNDSLPALKGKPIMISPVARAGYWQFLRVKFGYTDDQIRTYTFNMAPFLADKTAIQQGYLTSEPYKLQKAGANIVVMLLADGGYSTYSNTIETSWKLVNEKPDLVQRFVNATIEGWYSYLSGDPTPANALIKKENADMTDDQIAYSLGAMKKHGLTDSGDAEKLGIGAMTDARWKDFHSVMVEAGLYAPDLDLKRAYTLQFVNKKFGMPSKTGKS